MEVDWSFTSFLPQADSLKRSAELHGKCSCQRHTCGSMHTHTCMTSMLTHTFLHTQTHARTCTFTTHTVSHAYLCLCTHVYTHTHTPAWDTNPSGGIPCQWSFRASAGQMGSKVKPGGFREPQLESISQESMVLN